MNKVQSNQNRVPRHAPEISNTTERIKLDLERAKKVAKTLEHDLGESLKGLELVEARANKLLAQHDERLSKGETEEDPEGADSKVKEERWRIKRQLDLVLTYLRNAFIFCYYCGLECESFDELSKKCVEPHYRKSSSGEGGADSKEAKRGRFITTTNRLLCDLEVNCSSQQLPDGRKILIKKST